MQGAAILAAAHILVKVIGGMYKIPLDGMILGTTGMGIYNAAYTIYNLLFMISTAGLPIAISKLIAAALAVGNEREAETVVSVAKRTMAVVGMVGTLCLFFGADLFAALLSAPSAKPAIQALAPSIFFVSLLSVQRGYTQGCGYMLPTAVSEIAEASGKLILGLLFASFFVKFSLSLGAAGAILGVSCGTLLAYVLILATGRRCRRAQKEKLAACTQESRSRREILLKLLAYALPITLGASVFTLTTLIDTTMILRLLRGLGYSEETYLSLSGYLGRAVTMFNIPPTVIAAMAVSVVPALSAALAVGDKQAAGETTKSALRITILISVPCAIGLSVLAAPILRVLYRDGGHAFLLQIMGLAVAFVTLVQVGNAILQANGMVWRPVLFMLLGGLVKIFVNLFLVSRPEIHINGAPIGTLLCYATVMILNLITIRRAFGIRYEIGDFLLKPALSGLVMGACAYGTYMLLNIAFGAVISLAGAIGVGVLVYFGLVFALRGIPASDILLLPKGERILHLLYTLHIMRQ